MDQVEHAFQNPPDSNAPLSRPVRAWIKEELCALSAWLESGCRVLLVLLYAPDLDLAGEAKNIISAGNHAPRPAMLRSWFVVHLIFDASNAHYNRAQRLTHSIWSCSLATASGPINSVINVFKYARLNF